MDRTPTTQATPGVAIGSENTVETEWLANRDCSALHAAAMLCGMLPADDLSAGGATTDHATTGGEAGSAPLAIGGELLPALDRPLRRLLVVLDEYGLDRTQFFRHLVPLSAGIGAERQLAQVTLTKLIGSAEAERLTPTLAEPLGELRRAAQAAQPNLLDELQTRSGPLIEQWEARGPGLLRSLGRHYLPEELLVERATILPVYPVTGGHGVAHLKYNSVRIEAVLANPIERLPEVVRLGWLLAQLDCDLPRYSERLRPGNLQRVARLAMVPPVLAAAEYVELVSDAAAALPVALAAWGLDESDALAGQLTAWWRAYLHDPPPWPVALLALEQLIDR